ncbi:MAG: bifunctional DNA primase/polymerase, partial [Cyanobacteriota bacterium]
MSQQLLQQLGALPEDWLFVAVDGAKRAYQRAWQANPLTKEQVAAEIGAGRAKAIGVIAGPPTGLLFVDHDGISATDELERLGLPLRDLPPSLATTSGKDGRFQLIYRVSSQFWPAMRGRRVFRTAGIDADGKAEQLDLRWAGHYSVVAGAHPQTSGYRWIQGRGPGELALAEAPLALVELLLDRPARQPLPLLARAADHPLTAAGTVPFLEFISRASKDLIESGGTPGSWNDDQLALALDLKGTEAWIRAQGRSPDLTAAEAFEQHIRAASGKARDFDERKAWARFEGADAHSPHPSTPHDKLLDRLRYHSRPSRSVSSGSPAPTSRVESPAEQQPQGASLSRPQKLEAGELLC